MTCREITEFLADYRSGDLDPETRARFEEHLRACEPCVEYLRAYEETIRLARGAFARRDDAPPPGVPDGLIAAILASRRRSGGDLPPA